MWIVRPRQELPSVINLENGHYLGIRSSDDTRGTRTWEIVSNVPVPGVGPHIIMDGFKSFEDAHEAFGKLLAHYEIDALELDDPTVVAEVPADDETEKKGK